jgi:DNA-directed RNA polymerase specialized sigma subunit
MTTPRSQPHPGRTIEEVARLVEESSLGTAGARYADLSETQIATVMGISRGAVKTHTARAMTALRNALETRT